MSDVYYKTLSVFTDPQKRQVQNSWGLPASAQDKHVQPAEEPWGRTVRHAAHCRARGSFSNVQTAHGHSERAEVLGDSENTTGLVG